MNTYETYVSLETAKLLKQAGFDWEVDACYTYGDYFDFLQRPKNCNEIEHWHSAPTLSVAQKWLREVKGYYVFVTDDSQCVEPNLIWVITRPSYLAGMCKGSTYEDYLEAGINKCLTLLLKEE